MKRQYLLNAGIFNQLKNPVHLASIMPTDRLKIHGGEAFQNIFVACVW